MVRAASPDTAALACATGTPAVTLPRTAHAMHRNDTDAASLEQLIPLLQVDVHAVPAAVSGRMAVLKLALALARGNVSGIVRAVADVAEQPIDAVPVTPGVCKLLERANSARVAVSARHGACALASAGLLRHPAIMAGGADFVRFPDYTRGSGSWGVGSSSHDVVCFKCSTDSLLTAVAVLSSSGSMRVEINVFTCDGDSTGSLLASVTEEVSSSALEQDSAQFAWLVLDKPVPIVAGKRYAVKQTVHGASTMDCGSGGRTHVEADGITVTWSTFAGSNNGTDYNSGQIGGLRLGQAGQATLSAKKLDGQQWLSARLGLADDVFSTTLGTKSQSAASAFPNGVDLAVAWEGIWMIGAQGGMTTVRWRKGMFNVARPRGEQLLGIEAVGPHVYLLGQSPDNGLRLSRCTPGNKGESFKSVCHILGPRLPAADDSGLGGDEPYDLPFTGLRAAGGWLYFSTAEYRGRMSASGGDLPERSDVTLWRVPALGVSAQDVPALVHAVPVARIAMRGYAALGASTSPMQAIVRAAWLTDGYTWMVLGHPLAEGATVQVASLDSPTETEPRSLSTGARVVQGVRLPRAALAWHPNKQHDVSALTALQTVQCDVVTCMAADEPAPLIGYMPGTHAMLSVNQNSGERSRIRVANATAPAPSAWAWEQLAGLGAAIADTQAVQAGDTISARALALAVAGGAAYRASAFSEMLEGQRLSDARAESVPSIPQAVRGVAGCLEVTSEGLNALGDSLAGAFSRADVPMTLVLFSWLVAHVQQLLKPEQESGKLALDLALAGSDGSPTWLNALCSVMGTLLTSEATSSWLDQGAWSASLQNVDPKQLGDHHFLTKQQLRRSTPAEAADACGAMQFVADDLEVFVLGLILPLAPVWSHSGGEFWELVLQSQHAGLARRDPRSARIACNFLRDVSSGTALQAAMVWTLAGNAKGWQTFAGLVDGALATVEGAALASTFDGGQRGFGNVLLNLAPEWQAGCTHLLGAVLSGMLAAAEEYRSSGTWKCETSLQQSVAGAATRILAAVQRTLKSSFESGVGDADARKAVGEMMVTAVLSLLSELPKVLSMSDSNAYPGITRSMLEIHALLLAAVKALPESALFTHVEEKVYRYESVTMESKHPYENNTDFTKPLTVPGAESLEISFGDRTAMEDNYDYVQFRKSADSSDCYGSSKYTGTNSASYPGVSGTPPLEIPSDTVHVHFHTDSSGTDWGWHITAKGKIAVSHVVRVPAPLVQAARAVALGIGQQLASMLHRGGKQMTELVPPADQYAVACAPMAYGLDATMAAALLLPDGDAGDELGAAAMLACLAGLGPAAQSAPVREAMARGITATNKAARTAAVSSADNLPAAASRACTAAVLAASGLVDEFLVMCTPDAPKRISTQLRTAWRALNKARSWCSDASSSAEVAVLDSIDMDVVLAHVADMGLPADKLEAAGVRAMKAWYNNEVTALCCSGEDIAARAMTLRAQYALLCTAGPLPQLSATQLVSTLCGTGSAPGVAPKGWTPVMVGLLMSDSSGTIISVLLDLFAEHLQQFADEQHEVARSCVAPLVPAPILALRVYRDVVVNTLEKLQSQEGALPELEHLARLRRGLHPLQVLLGAPKATRARTLQAYCAFTTAANAVFQGTSSWLLRDDDASKLITLVEWTPGDGAALMSMGLTDALDHSRSALQDGLSASAHALLRTMLQRFFSPTTAADGIAVAQQDQVPCDTVSEVQAALAVVCAAAGESAAVAAGLLDVHGEDGPASMLAAMQQSGAGVLAPWTGNGPSTHSRSVPVLMDVSGWVYAAAGEQLSLDGSTLQAALGLPPAESLSLPTHHIAWETYADATSKFPPGHRAIELQLRASTSVRTNVGLLTGKLTWACEVTHQGSTSGDLPFVLGVGSSDLSVSHGLGAGVANAGFCAATGARLLGSEPKPTEASLKLPSGKLALEFTLDRAADGVCKLSVLRSGSSSKLVVAEKYAVLPEQALFPFFSCTSGQLSIKLLSMTASGSSTGPGLAALALNRRELQALSTGALDVQDLGGDAAGPVSEVSWASKQSEVKCTGKLVSLKRRGKSAAVVKRGTTGAPMTAHVEMADTPDSDEAGLFGLLVVPSGTSCEQAVNEDYQGSGTLGLLVRAYNGEVRCDGAVVTKQDKLKFHPGKVTQFTISKRNGKPQLEVQTASGTTTVRWPDDKDLPRGEYTLHFVGMAYGSGCTFDVKKMTGGDASGGATAADALALQPCWLVRPGPDANLAARSESFTLTQGQTAFASAPASSGKLVWSMVVELSGPTGEAPVFGVAPADIAASRALRLEDIVGISAKGHAVGCGSTAGIGQALPRQRSMALAFSLNKMKNTLAVRAAQQGTKPGRWIVLDAPTALASGAWVPVLYAGDQTVQVHMGQDSMHWQRDTTTPAAMPTSLGNGTLVHVQRPLAWAVPSSLPSGVTASPAECTASDAVTVPALLPLGPAGAGAQVMVLNASHVATSNAVLAVGVHNPRGSSFLVSLLDGTLSQIDERGAQQATSDLALDQAELFQALRETASAAGAAVGLAAPEEESAAERSIETFDPSATVSPGARVRVREGVSPRYGFGSVSPSEVGVVISIDGSDCKVRFPSHDSWSGVCSEMQVVTRAPAVGDRVRVYQGLSPSCGWGSVSAGDEGVVKSVSGESCRVDFPAQSGWNGRLHEMEIVRLSGPASAATPASAAASADAVTPGARVRVREGVSPSYGFGAVSPGEVGVVASLNGADCTVRFPSHSSWTGVRSEMEVVARAPAVGDRVRVYEGVTPSSGWGSVSAGDVGVVTSVTGSDQRCRIDFPAQSGWSGWLHEMEIVSMTAAAGAAATAGSSSSSSSSGDLAAAAREHTIMCYLNDQAQLTLTLNGVVIEHTLPVQAGAMLATALLPAPAQADGLAKAALHVAMARAGIVDSAHVCESGTDALPLALDPAALPLASAPGCVWTAGPDLALDKAHAGIPVLPLRRAELHLSALRVPRLELSLGQLAGLDIQHAVLHVLGGRSLPANKWAHMRARVTATQAQLWVNGALLGCRALPAQVQTKLLQGLRSEQLQALKREVESDHPYANNIDQHEELSFPGAQYVKVCFSSDSKTESGPDYIRFKLDGAEVCERFSGENWPGRNSKPPLAIPHEKVQYHWRTDGSVTDHGWKFTADPVYLSEDAKLGASLLPLQSLSGDCWLRPGQFVGSTMKGSNFPSFGFPAAKVTTGTWYMETEILAHQGADVQIGFGNDSFAPNSGGGQGVGDDEHSWAADGFRNKKWHNGSSSVSMAWSVGDTLCCVVNCEKRTIAFGVNGDWSGSRRVEFTGVKVGQGLYPVATASARNYGLTLAFRLGPRAGGEFKYKLPDGARAWEECVEVQLAELAARQQAEREAGLTAAATLQFAALAERSGAGGESAVRLATAVLPSCPALELGALRIADAASSAGVFLTVPAVSLPDVSTTCPESRGTVADVGQPESVARWMAKTVSGEQWPHLLSLLDIVAAAGSAEHFQEEHALVPLLGMALASSPTAGIMCAHYVGPMLTGMSAQRLGSQLAQALLRHAGKSMLANSLAAGLDRSADDAQQSAVAVLRTLLQFACAGEAQGHGMLTSLATEQWQFAGARALLACLVHADGASAWPRAVAALLLQLLREAASDVGAALQAAALCAQLVPPAPVLAPASLAVHTKSTESGDASAGLRVLPVGTRTVKGVTEWHVVELHKFAAPRLAWIPGSELAPCEGPGPAVHVLVQLGNAEQLLELAAAVHGLASAHGVPVAQRSALAGALGVLQAMLTNDSRALAGMSAAQPSVALQLVGDVAKLARSTPPPLPGCSDAMMQTLLNLPSHESQRVVANAVATCSDALPSSALHATPALDFVPASSHSAVAMGSGAWSTAGGAAGGGLTADTVKSALLQVGVPATSVLYTPVTEQPVQQQLAAALSGRVRGSPEIGASALASLANLQCSLIASELAGSVAGALSGVSVGTANLHGIAQQLVEFICLAHRRITAGEEATALSQPDMLPTSLQLDQLELEVFTLASSATDLGAQFTQVAAEQAVADLQAAVSQQFAAACLPSARSALWLLHALAQLVVPPAELPDASVVGAAAARQVLQVVRHMELTGSPLLEPLPPATRATLVFQLLCADMVTQLQECLAALCQATVAPIVVLPLAQLLTAVVDALTTAVCEGACSQVSAEEPSRLLNLAGALHTLLKVAEAPVAAYAKTKSSILDKSPASDPAPQLVQLAAEMAGHVLRALQHLAPAVADACTSLQAADISRHVQHKLMFDATLTRDPMQLRAQASSVLLASSLPTYVDPARLVAAWAADSNTDLAMDESQPLLWPLGAMAVSAPLASAVAGPRVHKLRAGTKPAAIGLVVRSSSARCGWAPALVWSGEHVFTWDRAGDLRAPDSHFALQLPEAKNDVLGLNVYRTHGFIDVHYAGRPCARLGAVENSAGSPRRSWLTKIFNSSQELPQFTAGIPWALDAAEDCRLAVWLPNHHDAVFLRHSQSISAADVDSSTPLAALPPPPAPTTLTRSVSSSLAPSVPAASMVKQLESLLQPAAAGCLEPAAGLASPPVYAVAELAASMTTLAQGRPPHSLLVMGFPAFWARKNARTLTLKSGAASETAAASPGAVRCAQADVSGSTWCRTVHVPGAASVRVMLNTAARDKLAKSAFVAVPFDPSAVATALPDLVSPDAQDGGGSSNKPAALSGVSLALPGADSRPAWVVGSTDVASALHVPCASWEDTIGAVTPLEGLVATGRHDAVASVRAVLALAAADAGGPSTSGSTPALEDPHRKLAAGDTVERDSEGWRWGEQDGGAGNHGRVLGDGSSTDWVRVEWANGHTNSYPHPDSDGKWHLRVAGAAGASAGAGSTKLSWRSVDTVAPPGTGLRIAGDTAMLAALAPDASEHQRAVVLTELGAAAAAVAATEQPAASPVGKAQGSAAGASSASSILAPLVVGAKYITACSVWLQVRGGHASPLQFQVAVASDEPTWVDLRGTFPAAPGAAVREVPLLGLQPSTKYVARVRLEDSAEWSEPHGFETLHARFSVAAMRQGSMGVGASITADAASVESRQGHGSFFSGAGLLQGTMTCMMCIMSAGGRFAVGVSTQPNALWESSAMYPPSFYGLVSNADVVSAGQRSGVAQSRLGEGDVLTMEITRAPGAAEASVRLVANADEASACTVQVPVQAGQPLYLGMVSVGGEHMVSLLDVGVPAAPALATHLPGADAGFCTGWASTGPTALPMEAGQVSLGLAADLPAAGGADAAEAADFEQAQIVVVPEVHRGVLAQALTETYLQRLDEGLVGESGAKPAASGLGAVPPPPAAGGGLLARHTSTFMDSAPAELDGVASLRQAYREYVRELYEATPAALDAHIVQFVSSLSADGGLSASAVLTAAWSDIMECARKQYRETHADQDPTPDVLFLRYRALGAVHSQPNGEAIIEARWVLLQALNAQVSTCASLVDLSNMAPGSLASHMSAVAHLLLESVKTNLWRSAVNGTTQSGGSTFELVLSQPRAARWRATGKPDVDGRYMIFSQAWRALQEKPLSALRRRGRLYKVMLAGERAHDDGGPYRQSWSMYCEDLQSKHLNVLGASPNHTSRANNGEARDAWVPVTSAPVPLPCPPSMADADASAELPTPHQLTSTQRSMLAFMGQIMGIALRNSEPLMLRLPRAVWAALASGRCSASDMASFDLGSYRAIMSMASAVQTSADGQETRMSPAEFSQCFLDTWAITTADGHVAATLPGAAAGAALEWNSRLKWSVAALRAASRQFDEAIAAIRTGLASVVPIWSLRLCSATDLELAIAGPGFVDVALLRSKTSYSSWSESDEVIRWFWDVVENAMSDEDRAALLTFVCGRPTLPHKGAWDRQFEIRTMSGRDCLPVSHTCYFQLDLPRYSSKEVLQARVLYAIHNCVTIDGDDTSTGMRGAAMGGGEWLG